MKRIEAVNDFVVKFANVNGSGSASANELFAKSFIRMGIAVSPRNIFPSNIQGLPNWYEVRVTEKGWLGRRGGADLVVAMNPQTWNQDVKEVEPGGYLFYDNTKVLPQSKFRDDIHVIGMPLTEICNREYTDARERQLFKNIIYVGALSALLGVDLKVVETLIAEQYRGKEKLLEPNFKALRMGRLIKSLNAAPSIAVTIPALYITFEGKGETDNLTMFLYAIYPILDGLILAPTMIAVILFFRGQVNFLWTMILFATLSMILADTLYLVFAVEKSYYPGHPIDILYLFSYTLYAFGVYSHIKLYRTPSKTIMKR